MINQRQTWLFNGWTCEKLPCKCFDSDFVYLLICLCTNARHTFSHFAVFSSRGWNADSKWGNCCRCIDRTMEFLNIGNILLCNVENDGRAEIVGSKSIFSVPFSVDATTIFGWMKSKDESNLQTMHTEQQQQQCSTSIRYNLFKWVFDSCISWIPLEFMAGYLMFICARRFQCKTSPHCYISIDTSKPATIQTSQEQCAKDSFIVVVVFGECHSCLFRRITDYLKSLYDFKLVVAHTPKKFTFKSLEFGFQPSNFH